VPLNPIDRTPTSVQSYESHVMKTKAGGIQAIRSRWLTKLALVLLALFTAALVHQVIPHDHGPHGHGAESCPFCVLMGVPVLAVASAIAVVPDCQLLIALIPAFKPPVLETCFPPFSNRGPPARSV